MREKVAPFYWAAAGALAGFGLMTIGGRSCSRAPSWPSPGSPSYGHRASGRSSSDSGGCRRSRLPATHIQRLRRALNPYCTQMGEPGALVAGAAEPGPVSVSFIPASYYAMFAAFAAVALFGVDLGRLLRSIGRHATSS